MFPILQVGSAAIPVAPIVVLIGVFLCATVVEHHAERLGLERTTVSNAIYIGFGAALLGARLVYASAHLAAYAGDPLSLLAPTPATLDPLGGLVFGIGAGALYGWKYGLPLWRTLDALAPGIVGVGLVLGLAHLASGDAFGAPARLPWSIYLWDDYRHPSQAYEILAALLILAGWWFLSRTKRFDGFQFWTVIAMGASAVLFLEAFRGDSYLFQGWRIVQVLALAALALALGCLRLLNPRASV